MATHISDLFTTIISAVNVWNLPLFQIIWMLIFSAPMGIVALMEHSSLRKSVGRKKAEGQYGKSARAEAFVASACFLVFFLLPIYFLTVTVMRILT